MPVPFSRGRPRNGQWVLIDGKIIGIAVEPDKKKKNGQSFFGVIGDVITRYPYPHDPDFMAALPDTSRFRVDVVDATGVNTVGSIMAGLGRLEPVVDIQQIPPERRATCAPGWNPRP